MELVQTVYQHAVERAKTGYRYLSAKIKLHHLICFFIFLEFVWSVSYYLSPVGRASLNSDLTTGVQHLEKVMEEKTLYPKNWIYTNTIGFPVLTPMALLLYKLTGDHITTVLLKFAVYLLFMAVSVWHFARHVLKMGKSLTAVMVFIILSPGSREYFNDVFYSGYAYRVAVFFLLLGFGMQCVQDSHLKLNKKYLCLYAVSVFLFVTGDMRYVAVIILPLVVAVVISYFTENYQTDIRKIVLPLKNFVLYLSAAGAAVCACMIAERYLKSKYTYVDGYFGASLISDLSDMWGRLKYMVTAYISAFGFTGGVPQMSFYSVLSLCSLVFALYIVVVNPVMMTANYKKLPFVLKQMMIYRWTGYAVISFFWLFSGGIVFRHVLTFLVLDILLAVYHVGDQLLLDGKVIKVFGCAVILFYMAFNWSHGSWLDIASKWNSPNAAATLENRDKIIEEIKKRGLTYGYAPYWTASITAAFSQEEIKIYPWNLYDRFRWYAPDELYLPADQDEATFLLFPEKEYGKYLKEDDFKRRWGDYQEAVKESGYVLLVYDYNAAVNFGEFSCFSGNLLKSMLISEGSGQSKSDCSAIYLEPEQYVYGPYTNLTHGAYVLNIRASGSAFLNIYALLEKDGKSITKNIDQAELKKGDNKIAFYLFEDIERVEFNITNQDKEEIRLTNMSLEHKEADTLPAQMHVSRQDHRNTADTVWLAPGEVLFGPYIRAEQGKYKVYITVDHDTELNIWAEEAEHKILQQDLSPGENEISFELSEDIPDLEFVVRNSGSEELKITGLQAEKMKD